MKIKKAKNVFKGISCIALVMGLLACDGNDKFGELSDYQLSEEYGKCLDRKPSAPGAKIICENYKKECDKRKKELGSFVCRTY